MFYPYLLMPSREGNVKKPSAGMKGQSLNEGVANDY